MIALLLALLALLFHGPTPVPHDHGGTVAPAPAAVAPAPAHGGSRGPSSPSPAGRLDGGVSHLPQPVPAPPTVAAPAPGTYVNPGEWLDMPTPDDVQPQLPDETTGRAYG